MWMSMLQVVTLVFFQKMWLQNSVDVVLKFTYTHYLLRNCMLLKEAINMLFGSVTILMVDFRI